MELSIFLINLVILTISFIISAIPLYFAVKFLKGKTTFLKAMLINILAGIIISIISASIIIFAGLIAYLILVIIYHLAFRLKWWKSFLVWFFQLAIIILFYIITYLILNLLIGISIFV